MFLVDLLLAFVVAAVLSLLLLLVRGPQIAYEGGSRIASVLFFFLILFFATWAGGVWITPFGPLVGGVYWLPFLVIGLFVALLLAAVADPSRRGYTRSTMEPGGMEGVAAAMAFGLLYWTLMMALAAAIIAGYSARWFPAGPLPPSGGG